VGRVVDEEASADVRPYRLHGLYGFHGDRVIHHIELSLFPNGSAATKMSATPSRSGASAVNCLSLVGI
jgi:hypothetical protein